MYLINDRLDIFTDNVYMFNVICSIVNILNNTRPATATPVGEV